MRTATSRHFFGGFFGGLCGILLFGYLQKFSVTWLTPALIPLGAFVGFCLGFAYDKVWLAAKQLGSSAKTVLQNKKEPLIQNLLVGCYVAIYLVAWLCWVITTPVRVPYLAIRFVYRWFRANPYHPMWVLQAFSGAVVMAVNVTVFTRVFHAWIFESVMLSLFIMLFTLLTFAAVNQKESYFHISQPRNVQRYLDSGTVIFTVKTIYALLKAQIPVLSLGIFCYYTGTMAEVAFLINATVFLGIPSVILLLCFRGLLNAAEQSKPWISLMATLGITAGTAIFWQGNLSGTNLWVAALSAGTLSGVISESLRRLIAPRISYWRITTWLRKPMGQRVVWILETDEKAKKAVLEWMRPGLRLFAPESPI